MDEIERLIDSVTHFQQQHYGEKPELASSLKTGQSPKALLVGCSDSRVDPVLLTNCAPGDLFMIRNVANLVPSIGREPVITASVQHWNTPSSFSGFPTS